MSGRPGWRGMLLIALLPALWAGSVQAFSFCFSFGSGGGRYPDAGYGRADTAPGYFPGGYPAYPYPPDRYDRYAVPAYEPPLVPAGSRADDPPERWQ